MREWETVTDGMQSGLRHRLRRALRHMEAQHRHLGPIRRELYRAVEDGASVRILEWLTRYSDALWAHFDLEEGTVFPAVRGLGAGTREEIDRLVRDHAGFLERLSDFCDRDEGASLGLRELEAFERALREHESREEALMASVVEGER